MSNQVFSNSTKKYRGDLGLNYLLKTAQSVPVGETNVLWDGVEYISNTSSFRKETGNSTFTILEDGFYCIDATIALIPETNPATTDISAITQFLLTRTGGTTDTSQFTSRVFSRIAIYSTPRGGVVGNDDRSFQMSMNMFFKEGDQFSIVIDNNGSSNFVILGGSTNTSLSIQKVF